MKFGEIVEEDQLFGTVVVDKDDELWTRGEKGWYWLRLIEEPKPSTYGHGPDEFEWIYKTFKPLKYVGNPSQGKAGLTAEWT